MSTAVRRAIYGRMAGDTTLNALLGTPPTGYAKSIYHQEAPAGVGYPLVIFQRQTGRPTEAFGAPSAMENDVWLVKAVDHSTSADTAEAVAARIQVLLNDAALSISGASLLYLRRQSDIEYPEVTDGERYAHAGALYRLVTA
jgi:hypothetical protein